MIKLQILAVMAVGALMHCYFLLVIYCHRWSLLLCLIGKEGHLFWILYHILKASLLHVVKDNPTM